MKKLVTFIRITLWLVVWLAFLAFLIEFFVNNKELYQTDLDNIKATNVLIENILVDIKTDMSTRQDSLKIFKLSPRGQKIAKQIVSLQHITDSTRLIIEQLNLRDVNDFKKSLELVQLFWQQIDVHNRLKYVGCLYKDNYLSYIEEYTKWSFLLRMRNEAMYQTMELHPKILLEKLHYHTFMMYYKEIEKEKT